jgi:hypothetical protein
MNISMVCGFLWNSKRIEVCIPLPLLILPFGGAALGSVFAYLEAEIIERIWAKRLGGIAPARNSAGNSIDMNPDQRISAFDAFDDFVADPAP